MVEKIKLLDDVDLVRIYSAWSLLMTQFEVPQGSARKWSSSLSVLGSLIKPAPVVSREQGTGECDFRRSPDVWPLGSGWASAKLKRHGTTYMVAVLSCSPHTLQIIDGCCQHFWPEIRRFVRGESIGRIFIWSYLVFNKMKHYWMESLVHQAWNLISQVGFQRQPSFVLLYLGGCPFIHLSGSLRVLRRDASPLLCGPRWWTRTLAGKHRFHRPGGGCGCGAAGGGQSWRTPSAKHRWTFIKALVLKEIQEKMHFLWLWLPEITSFMVWTGVLTY